MRLWTAKLLLHVTYHLVSSHQWGAVITYSVYLKCCVHTYAISGHGHIQASCLCLLVVMYLLPYRDIKHQCLFSKLAARCACFHGVLINVCNFLVVCSCVETNWLCCILGGYFSANFCPVFICFLQPEIKSSIYRLLPTQAYWCKVLGIKNQWEVLLIPGYVFIQRLCLILVCIPCW